MDDINDNNVKMKSTKWILIVPDKENQNENMISSNKIVRID